MTELQYLLLEHRHLSREMSIYILRDFLTASKMRCFFYFGYRYLVISLVYHPLSSALSVDAVSDVILYTNLMYGGGVQFSS